MEEERRMQTQENLARVLRGERDKDPKRAAAGKRLARENKERKTILVFGILGYILYTVFEGGEKEQAKRHGF